VSEKKLPSLPMIIQENKITAYLLNLDHPKGGSKAKFFMGRGFTLSAVKAFTDALMVQGQTNPVVKETETGYGLRYIVKCACPTPDASNPCVRTVWQAEREGLKLITVMPK
jgi:hypothetical protein